MTRVAIRLGSSKKGQVVEWRFGILIKEDDDGIVQRYSVHDARIYAHSPKDVYISRF